MVKGSSAVGSTVVAQPIATFDSDALIGHAAPAPAVVPSRKSDITPEDAAAIIKWVRDLPPEVKLCLMRFWSGGMSYGSISLEAHETIATAINLIAMGIHNVDTMEELVKLGIKGMPFSNSGEGGERPDRNGTIKQSRARQKATACFGVNLAYLVYSVILQHKGNQGGKAGIGGQLMAIKVTVEIANTRMTPDHVDLKSPAPHHDIYSIEDLAIWIHSIHAVNPDAIISVKLAATEGIGVIAAALVKAGVKNISIAGPGGTGAAPLEAKYNFARPWEAALAEVHRTLTENGLRDGVTLTVSGGFQTGEEAAKALLLGADNIELGTFVLSALGCVMAEDCHTGNCPAGLATTNQDNIDQNFKGTAFDVVRLLTDLATSLSDSLDEIGISDPADAVGMAYENLEVEPGCPVTGMEQMLEKPVNPYTEFVREPQPDVVSKQEKKAIEEIRGGQRVVEVNIDNTILSFPARIANKTLTDPDIEKAFENPVTIKVNGEAVGQNFGCYIPENMILDARNSNGNDHVGKGISGGRVIAKTAGGAAGYGGTDGEIYATFFGDRAGVRNSGVHYITEQVGECGANYTTTLKGTWTVWGMPKDYPISFSYGRKNPIKFRSKSIGANFGAGSSAGIFFIPKKLYHEMVASHYFADELLRAEVQTLDAEEAQTLKRRLAEYREYFDKENQSWLQELAHVPDLENHFVKLDPRVRMVVPPAIEPSATPEVETPVLEVSEPIVEQEKTVKAALAVLAAVTESERVTVEELQQDVTLPTDSDACGIGTYVNLDGIPTRENATNAFKMLARMKHRGSSGVDPNTGDGCGMVFYGLDGFFQKLFPHLSLVKGHYSIIPMSLGDSDETESRELLQSFLEEEGLSIQGERDVLKDQDLLGEIGKRQENALKQYVVIKPDGITQEAFEKKLIRARLRFELTLQKEKKKNRAHIFSASSYHVIYKTLVKEDKFGSYFVDFIDEDFKTSAAVSHARYATNTLPNTLNIQCLAEFANNGENNALMQIIRLLVNEPIFKKIVKLDKIDLSGLSDSHIMSIFMDFLVLLGYSIEEIVTSTIHPYDAEESIFKIASEFYNLLAVPFEGPNASVIYRNDKIVFVRDKNGFRPLRGKVNKQFLFAGSELGPVEMSDDSEVFDLAPGRAVVLDLKTGTFTEVTPQMTDEMAKKLAKFNSVAPKKGANKKPPILYSKEELTQRKLRAGWNDEVNEAIMNSLFEGKNALTSMGDQGPVEVLVKGMLLDIANFFKGNFSQYTNPPLAQHEEERYMSTKVFVGKKSGLEELAFEHVASSDMRGVVVDSPIVSNEELESLQNDPRLRSKVIDIIFSVDQGEKGLRDALEEIVNESIQAVREGHTLIILSDLKTDDNHAAIPAVLIASMVDQALLINGLRRQASIALQAASMLSGRDIAQAVSIGGVDVVNPYLPFTPETEEQANSEEFKKRGGAYKKALRDSLLSFMARMGISSVTAYRGTKGFGAYGLDAELSALFGVPSTFGGFGMSMLADVTIHHHEHASVKGAGKWNYSAEQGQASRRRFWGDGNASYAAGVARRRPGNTFNEFERKVKNLKRGFASSWLRFKNKRWTRKNPMPVFILGGGAAGFYQAQSLLESKLHIKIIIIEQNIGNKFGLMGDGVAVDHYRTKENAALRAVLSNDQVEYYGGVEVDGKGNRVNVSYEELRQLSPCIIDCRGAPQDNKLNVPGENPPYVIPASTVHKSYNGAFEPGVEPWAFDPYNRNPMVGIIGIGNVALDLARIFLKDPALLEKTSITRDFLQSLETGPSVVRIFARKSPQDYAGTTSLIGLRELVALGIDISATFTPLSKEEFLALSREKKEIYNFFEQYRDRKYSVSGRKRLHFHFQTNAREFQPHTESKGVIGTFNNVDGSTSTFKAQTFITAISTDIPPDRSKAPYSSGWAAGNGGTLAVAQNTAEETTAQIVKDFESGTLKREITKPTLSTLWRHRSPVSKGDYIKYMQWVDAGNPLQTEEDAIAAKGLGGSVVMEARPSKKDLPKPGPNVDRTTIRVRNHKTGIVTSYDRPTKKQTVLAFVDEKAPNGEVLVATCGGKATCNECRFEITQADAVPDIHRKERGKVGDNIRFGCLHDVEELAGGTEISLVDAKPAFPSASAPEATGLAYDVPSW